MNREFLNFITDDSFNHDLINSPNAMEKRFNIDQAKIKIGKLERALKIDKEQNTLSKEQYRKFMNEIYDKKIDLEKIKNKYNQYVNELLRNTNIHNEEEYELLLTNYERYVEEIGEDFIVYNHILAEVNLRIRRKQSLKKYIQISILVSSIIAFLGLLSLGISAIIYVVKVRAAVDENIKKKKVERIKKKKE